MENIILNKQERRVFDYMTENGGITTLEAFNEVGVARLASRISDMKKKGVQIRKENISVRNRFGEKCTVCRYSIA